MKVLSSVSGAFAKTVKARPMCKSVIRTGTSTCPELHAIVNSHPVFCDKPLSSVLQSKIIEVLVGRTIAYRKMRPIKMKKAECQFLLCLSSNQQLHYIVRDKAVSGRQKIILFPVLLMKVLF
jgi:hypothetical protein